MSDAYEEDLTAFVDGELPALRAKQVETHLATCAGCRGTEALLRRTATRLRELPVFEPSAGMRRVVLHRIDEAPGLWARLKAAFAPAVLMPSMGLAAAVAVAVLVDQSTRRAPKLALGDAQLELAANWELLEDYDVIGLERPEDVEVVQHLQELEATP